MMSSLFRLLTLALGLGLAQPLAVLAQTNPIAPLPPAAQEALNKGIIAAKLPDYPLAIRYFAEARKLAPQDPVVFLNLGLAESKVPGRELRAMAWFGAYLSAYPAAPNAAAVKEQIAVLEVKSQSNISRLIKSVQDAAGQISDYKKDYALADVAKLWANAGDITAAHQTTDLIQSALAKVYAQSAIAEAQAISGDIAGAQKTLASALKTADPIQGEEIKGMAQLAIATAQVNTGDTAGAQKTIASALQTADLIRDATLKSIRREAIAKAQLKAGDIAGALKTADLIQDAFWKSNAQLEIGEAQVKAGDITGAQETLASAQKVAALIQSADKDFRQGIITIAQRRAGEAAGAEKPGASRQLPAIVQPPTPPVPTVSDWLNKLDDDKEHHACPACPLNTGPFLDLAGYLKSRPPANDPQWVFNPLRDLVKIIVNAQNSITGMLKQQAKG